MNPFWKFPRWLGLLLLLQLNVHAATDDTAKFSGTVVDTQGNPVPGAAVDYYQYPARAPMRMGSFDLELKQHVETDAKGAFTLSTSKEQGFVLVTKAGLAPGWRSLYTAQSETQKMVLGAPSALAGTVVDDAGQPVADAEVWVVFALNKDLNSLGQPNFLVGNMARKLFSAQTSAAGKFRIENFPANAQANLTVKKKGMAMRQAPNPARYDELSFHAGQENIALTLDPPGSVTGKVLVRGTGQPVAFATVGLLPATLGMQFSGVSLGTNFTASDGTFRIPDVSAGSYRLRTDFTNQPIADWIADAVPVTVAAGQTVSDVQVQAYKGGVVVVTIRGKKNHELLANTTVSVNSQDYNHAGSTGSNGVAFFRLPPGQFSVFANKPDWSAAQTQVTITEGQTNQVNLELDEPFKISGIVRNSSGAPVAGASVGVFPDYQNGGTSITAANGHYTLTWQKPAWEGMQNQPAYLVARQMDLNLAAIQEFDETKTNLDVTLKPAMSVSSRVQDASGKAITNVMAYISLHEENSSFSLTRQPAVPDGQGRIQVNTLPLGERYGWFVSAPGYGSGQQAMDAADPKADHYDFPPLILKRADRKLAGRVLGTNGQAAAGVQVWMNGEGQPNGNTTTDTDGRFSYEAVCAGPVSVSANGNGFSASTEAMGGDTNLVLRFEARNNNVYVQPAQQTVTGTVFDPAGKHAVGALVVVSPSWGPINNYKTDDNGDFSVGWQPQIGMRDAKYFVIARDLEKNLAAIEPLDTNSTHMSLRLVPGLSISGVVQDRDGAPLTRANINLNIMAGNMGGMVGHEPIKIGSDGSFTITALPLGQQYFVNASAKGYGNVSRNIGKSQSQTNSLQLSPFKLKLADRPLAGKVVDTNNKPVPGAQVNINGDGQPNGNVRTDEDGKFKFTVCDGPIRIFVWSQSGSGRNNSGNAQANGGDVNVVVKLGEIQRRGPMVTMEAPLKPQAWTLSAVLSWPTAHKTGVIILLSVQAAVLLGTSGGIFWLTRKRK